MESVGVGDDVEGVGAAAAGVEGDALRSQLMPGEDLAGEEEQAEGEGCEQPGQGATRGRAAETEPLFHGVDLVEHVAARDLHGDGAEQQDGGVEPEDGRDGGGQPGIDVAVVGVDVAGGFGVDEDADDADEEHDDGSEGEEEAKAVGGETLAGAARAAGGFIAIVVIAAAAGALEVAAIGRAPAVAAIVLFNPAGTAFEIGRRDDGRQETHLMAHAMGRAY